MDNSRICHCRYFMSMVSKNFVQPFLRSRELLRYTHAWTELHKLSWAESLGLMMSLFMALILKRTELLCVIWRHRLWAACPCLSLSAVVFSRSIGVEFVHWTWICFSTCANLNIRSFTFKFLVYGHKQTSKQASRHTHARAQCSHTSVGLAQARPNYLIIYLPLVYLELSFYDQFYRFQWQLQHLYVGDWWYKRITQVYHMLETLMHAHYFLDLEKLKLLCLKHTIPVYYRSRVWKLLLGKQLIIAQCIEDCCWWLCITSRPLF